jgi:hypothetical protein
VIGNDNKIISQFVGSETYNKLKYRMVEFEQGKLKFNNGEKILVFDIAF